MGWGVSDGAVVNEAVESLIDDRADVYHDLLCSQTMLRALARDGFVAMPTAGEFVKKHGFRAASSAAFSLNDLRARDLVYETAKGWTVYDRLFGKWLARGESN